jgi:hypothetical protein
MKCLISGLIILITGVILSVQNANERYDKTTNTTKKRDIGMYIYPYLIPVGVTISTAGIRKLMNKNGKKKLALSVTMIADTCYNHADGFSFEPYGQFNRW